LLSFRRFKKARAASWTCETDESASKSRDSQNRVFEARLDRIRIVAITNVCNNAAANDSLDGLQHFHRVAVGSLRKACVRESRILQQVRQLLTSTMAALSAVSPILERFEVVCARIDAEVTRLDQPLLRQLQQQTGLRYAYLILGASFLLFAFIFLGFGAAFFSHIIGFLYPAYASFKAIESAARDDDKQWVRASPNTAHSLAAVCGRCRIRLPLNLQGRSVVRAAEL
jgi:hypothetical protein